MAIAKKTPRTEEKSTAPTVDVVVILGTTTCPKCRTDKFSHDREISRQVYDGKLLIAHARRCLCGQPYLYKTSQPAPPHPPQAPPLARIPLPTVERPTANGHLAPVRYF